MAIKGDGVAENMMIAGLDQDWQAAVDWWDRVTPSDRNEIAQWVAGNNGDIANAPDWVRQGAVFFASIAVLETGYRWSQSRV